MSTVILIDVNVLVYAYNEQTPDHRSYRDWLLGVLSSDRAFGVPDLALSGFLRVVTHPKVFNPPSPLDRALAFADALRGSPNFVPAPPGPRHWDIFTRLCRETAARGNLIPDAYLGAIAIESGDEWVTTDRDYSRFPGLRWRHPLA